MHDHLHRLSILALPLSLIFSVAIIVSHVSSAQGPSCLGVNRCETWVSNGGTVHVAALFCSQSRNSASCNVQEMARIPTSCGSGSQYLQSMTCDTNNLGAHTSYYCAATDVAVLKAIIGPGQCGAAPSPSPTPSPTPCRTRIRVDFCQDDGDCCWGSACDLEDHTCYPLANGEPRCL